MAAKDKAEAAAAAARSAGPQPVRAAPHPGRGAARQHGRRRRVRAQRLRAASTTARRRRRRCMDDKKLHKELKRSSDALARRDRRAARRAEARQAQEEAQGRHRPPAARRDHRRRRRARRERGPAQQGARRAVRRRGGVRLHVDQHASPAARSRRPRRVPAEPIARKTGWSRGRPRGALRRCWPAWPVALRARWKRRPTASAPCPATRPRGSSTRCARRSRGAASRGRRSTTSRARRASRAACCTTTSARRSSCSPRSCAATATCGWRSLDAQLADARTADDFIAGLVAELEELVDAASPSFVTLIFELFTLSRRNEEIAAEFAELLRRTRDQLAELLAAKERRGRPAPARRARGGRRRALLARPTASRCGCSPSPSATGRRRSPPACMDDPRRCSTRRVERAGTRDACTSRVGPAGTVWLASQCSRRRMLRLDRVLRRRRGVVLALWLVALVAAVPFAARQSDHLTGGGYGVPGSQSERGRGRARARLRRPRGARSSPRSSSARAGAERRRRARARSRRVDAAPCATDAAWSRRRAPTLRSRRPPARRRRTLVVPLRSPSTRPGRDRRRGRPARARSASARGRPARRRRRAPRRPGRAVGAACRRSPRRTSRRPSAPASRSSRSSCSPSSARSPRRRCRSRSAFVSGARHRRADLRAVARRSTCSVFVTNMASMIGIGVAVDYSLFVLARYREEIRAGRAPPRRARDRDGDVRPRRAVQRRDRHRVARRPVPHRHDRDPVDGARRDPRRRGRDARLRDAAAGAHQRSWASAPTGAGARLVRPRRVTATRAARAAARPFWAAWTERVMRRPVVRSSLWPPRSCSRSPSPALNLETDNGALRQFDQADETRRASRPRPRAPGRARSTPVHGARRRDRAASPRPRALLAR